jgi:hypothetical protein
LLDNIRYADIAGKRDDDGYKTRSYSGRFSRWGAKLCCLMAVCDVLKKFHEDRWQRSRPDLMTIPERSLAISA